MPCTLFSTCVELEACKTRHTQPVRRHVTFDLPLPIDVSDTPMRTHFARVFSFGCTSNQPRMFADSHYCNP